MGAFKQQQILAREQAEPNEQDFNNSTIEQWKAKASDLMQQSATGAKKANKGKPRMSLLPAKPLIEVAKVLTAGAEIYGDHNWRKGMPYTVNLDAALRHIYKFIDGQDTDEDSKLSHLAHAIVDLMFVLEYQLTGTGEDDRFVQGATK